MTSESRAVTTGSFHTDQHHLTQRRHPAEELPITGHRRGKRRGADQPAVLIKRGRDMHIEVGVDPTSDLCSHVRVFSLRQPIGEDTRPAGTADKTTTSLTDRLLVSHSARPVGVG